MTHKHSLIALFVLSASVTAMAQTQNAPPNPGESSDDSAVVLSKLITAETLEAEIKAASRALAGQLRTPVEFSRRGYRNCRLHFSELAVLFQAISQYDQAVPWKSQSARVAAICSRNARNCKVGSRAAYEAAKQTSDDLSAMIGGDEERLPSIDAKIETLGDVADRAPLMSRMERSLMESLPRYLGSPGDGQRKMRMISREAEMIAMIGAVIGDKGAEDADDDEYREHAQRVTQSAQAVAAAIRAGKLADARDAAERIKVACNKCHENYR